MNYTQGTSHDCKVLCVGKNEPAINFPVTNDDTIAIGSFDLPEFYRLIGRGYECINFFKSSVVEKQADPFSCCKFSF
jgi:hypothetical protein